MTGVLAVMRGMDGGGFAAAIHSPLPIYERAVIPNGVRNLLLDSVAVIQRFIRDILFQSVTVIQCSFRNLLSLLMVSSIIQLFIPQL
jgi:hypothetical protein